MRYGDTLILSNHKPKEKYRGESFGTSKLARNALLWRVMAQKAFDVA